MPPSSWQKWWNRVPARKGAADQKTRFRKCFLEILEDRTLLSANTYVVNITNDAGIGSGLSGDIRYCINQANLSGNAGSTITFDKSIGSTVFLSGTELAIQQNMTIQGPVGGGLTISGQNFSRVFDITSPTARVTISNLTIADGDATPSFSQFVGNQGGDIFNSGNLTLKNDIVSNGQSLGIIGGPPARGGGIFNARNATLTLTNTTVTGNLAQGNPDAIFGFGLVGGVGAGGGIYNDTGATLIVGSGSIISNNRAIGSSGAAGFSISPPAPPGAARGIPGGDGTDGKAGFDGDGGGIYNNGSLSISRLSGPPIIVSGNVARGGDGGNGGFGGPGGGGTKATGGTGGAGGNGGKGGNGFGGGIYNAVGSVTIDGAQFLGNQALGGSGGSGGKGGKAGSGKPGGVGGHGGDGADAGQAWGGGFYNVGGDLTIGQNVGSLFASNLARNGAAGNGGSGGTGGTGNSFVGGAGGAGGTAGGGTFAYGGALSVVSGNVSIFSTGFGGPSPGQGNQVIGGAGGLGGLGGTGGKGGGAGIPGGRGGFGGAGGNGSFVKGGAISAINDAGNITLSQDDFEGNSIVSGAGGSGGDGGTGGQGGKGSFGGTGGLGGTGHQSGEAWGGAFSYVAPDVDDGLAHSLTITATPFLNDSASVSAGGNGGLGGQGGPPGKSTAPGASGTNGTGGLGQDGRGGGLFVYSGAVSLPVSISSSTFSNDHVKGSAGGSGFPGGDGSAAYGGAVYLWATTLALNTATITNTPLTNNTATAGAGGSGGGNGGSVHGGALASDNYSVTLNSSPVTGNKAVSGGGGGGAAGAADGGGIAATGEAIPGVSYSLVGSDVSNNTLLQGDGSTGGGSAGGLSGGVLNGARGGGISFTGVSAQLNLSNVDSNSATAGAGGVGFSSFASGQTGGSGGAALGGGVFFYNNLTGSLSLQISNGSVSHNQVTGGNGGLGGNAGSFGSAHVRGGQGGDGGQAAGGGIYTLAGSTSINNTTLTNLLLQNEKVTAGSGGNGGQGEDANGGQGALAVGGGLYVNSLNTSTASTTNLQNATITANQVQAGSGGTSGSGTTPNGGNGGNGGGGGNAEGGGVFDGDNNQLSVFNTTIGGLSSNPSAPASNTLAAGDGGNGGNAGTPAGAPTNDGGNGGNGGTVMGGGVFINSGAANFVNNTIVNNQAVSFGQGGAPGAGAGTGGLSGSIGSSGTGIGGGYFYNAGTGNLNQVGNSIIDLNTASSDSDVRGAFSSLGHNLLGSAGDATGFSSTAGGTDRLGITKAQLNLGPLLNNGGTAMTDALLRGSVAIDGGSNILLPSSFTTDERGTGFSRIFNNVIDIGAVEFQPPQITRLSQNTVERGQGPVTLTITGTDFLPGAVVTFGGITLVPTSITGSQIVVVIPASNLIHHGTFPITVSNPDGSGIPGHTQPSTAANFTVTLPATLPLNPIASQTNNESDAVSLQISSPDPDAGNFTATGLPPGLSINSATGVISGTIDPHGTGTYSITIGATDSTTTGSLTFSWTVADSNPPTISNPGPQTNIVGDLVNRTISIVDADPGTVTITGLPPGLSFNTTTGVISGTLAANNSSTSSSNGATTYTVTVSAKDGNLASSVTFNWTVNLPPGASVPGQNVGSVNIGGFSFSLPAPGQSAGLFGLALEEFELTLNSDLAFIFSMAGLANKQFQEPIAALLAAINGDPLMGTPMGSFALMLGYTAAVQIL